VFSTISRRYWLPGFVMHNIAAVFRELAILLPIVAVAYWLRRPQWYGSRRRREAPEGRF
jgi:hypothetical protein